MHLFPRQTRIKIIPYNTVRFVRKKIRSENVLFFERDNFDSSSLFFQTRAKLDIAYLCISETLSGL